MVIVFSWVQILLFLVATGYTENVVKYHMAMAATIVDHLLG
jgi:hypothetical protein